MYLKITQLSQGQRAASEGFLLFELHRRPTADGNEESSEQI
jgi:hypothetical protein